MHGQAAEHIQSKERLATISVLRHGLHHHHCCYNTLLKDIIIFFLNMVYWACSTAPNSTACLSSTIYNGFYTFRLSKSIDSMNTKNSLLYFYMRSSLLAGHVPICCFRSSLWAFISSQWNIMWSMDWYSFPHLHFASSLRWIWYKYAFVIPCPGSTDIIMCCVYNWNTIAVCNNISALHCV
jgi:hypothetical protein